MKNFTYHVPTKVIFGSDREREVGQLLRKEGTPMRPMPRLIGARAGIIG